MKAFAALMRPYARQLSALQNALLALTMAFGFCLILLSLITRMILSGW